MQAAIVIALICTGSLLKDTEAVEEFRIGGAANPSWAEWTGQNRMVDDFSDPAALQPRELKPDENLLPQLGPWYRWRSPGESQYRPGDVRIWRGINYLRPRFDPRNFVDGDPTTFFTAQSYAGIEFYTIDLGTSVPVERFAFYPPEGKDALTQEPYRPNYTFEQYELSGSVDATGVATEEGDAYRPLDILLASVNLNTEAVVQRRFPLQYLRFFRIQFFPDQGRTYSKFALAELEVYGRGFPPLAVWESQVVDLGQVVNIGRLRFGVSKWRREGEQIVSAPAAAATAHIEIKTGLDDTPIGYHSYDDIGQLVEVAESEYGRLKERIWPWDPPAVGWRGPIVADADHWGFWSPPLRTSGQRPRVPRGRYIQVRATLATETLFDFARLDSLAIAFAPLLAERVVGEVAAAADLRPLGNLVQVQAGAKTEFIYDLRAEFTSPAQVGFDAVRLLLPSAGDFLTLEMGQPLRDMAPDSVVTEPTGLVVYLPTPINQQQGAQALRLHLATTIYGASGELQAEVFARSETELPQTVESGDASEELGTNQLRVVATGQSLASVLANMTVLPPTFTPQGDGINDQLTINYTLFRILSAAEVGVEIFTLGGQLLWRQMLGPQQAGRHQAVWDGRDTQGRLAAPGIYLARIQVDTDRGRFARVQSLAIVY